ncbi:hypothetical protein HH310_28745 [Actinoplanes sp. TBRC 11911]|uniref:LysR family substrate-binding domain-containing protein n=1 Tax=Actinoplanes sp. TBRC 11911 TaxID=2729386 RepID=UPI00145E0591|nr:LysR family substrate-binding domain-containing protein [Actinoplanes sp. TBRC 11911]NMO55161.1 hypothetical protein [Actinoplanes sp. TBRC 11911]
MFDRPPRPIALTAAGQALLDRVTPALAMVEQGVAESRATAGEQSETLTVSHLSSFAVRLVPLIVGTLRATHPRLLLTLHEASLPEQLAALRAGRVQIGLVHTNTDLPLLIPDLRAVTIATGPRMIMVPAGHPLAVKDAVVLSDAATQPFVLPSGDGQTGYRAGIERTCRRYGFTPLPAAQANDTGVIVELVAAGMGVALLPWFAATDLPRDVVARPLADERCELVALTTPHAPRTASALIAAAREAVEKLTTAVSRSPATGADARM